MGQTFKAANAQAVWAHRNVSREFVNQLEWFFRAGQRHHWSRVFEYPWILQEGSFEKGQRVLDAAGGNALLQYHLQELGCIVTNVDSNSDNLPDKQSGIICVEGDLRSLWPTFRNDVFDRVICCSVLEHIEECAEVLGELWRVLKVGGRLLVTMDVAGYRRWNHTIDEHVAKGILEWFGLQLPAESEDIASLVFDELGASKWEPKEVQVRCMCFCCDKVE